jgi:uncharacterized membrane protein
MSLLIDIVVSSILLLLLDGIWLGLIMRNYYKDLVYRIQARGIELNYIAAALCYSTLIFGLIYFVIRPIKKFNIIRILSLSVPFGLVTFGTYDFTSAAVLKNFDLLTAFIDLLWGMTVMSLTATGVIYSRRFFDSEEQSQHEDE